MLKREKLKTAADTKTEKPGIFSAKTEKTISKVTKTAKMSPSYGVRSCIEEAVFHQALSDMSWGVTWELS